MLLSSWKRTAYLAYFGHFFNQSNLNLLKQQLLDLNLNELQMNKQTAHVTLPTIPVCTSAVADTARLAASPCRSKCCTAEVQHGATTPQIRSTGTQATLKVGDEAKDAKALAQKILQNSTDMYRHVQTIKWFKMIVWISSATQLLWAWDEPPEPMTTSWESTTRQLHQNLKTGSVHGLIIYGKIMTFVQTPWDPYWS